MKGVCRKRQNEKESVLLSLFDYIEKSTCVMSTFLLSNFLCENHPLILLCIMHCELL